MNPLIGNSFSDMQRKHYDGVAPHWGDYRHHNDNPDYWYVLMAPLREGDFEGKLALDFGSGQGRNIANMLNMSPLLRADGCDISPENNRIAREKLNGYAGRFLLYDVNGVELNGVPSDTYDFVSSVVVLQHICVHSIRTSILKDILRVMRPGGILSFQMGFGSCGRPTVGYYEDRFDATDTNGALDVKVSSPAELYGDLERLGYADLHMHVRPSWDCAHENWVYVRASKPKTIGI